MKKLLFVEGIDDLKFFKAFVNSIVIHDIVIEAYNGASELYRTLKALSKRPDFNDLSAVAITGDADTKTGHARFQDIQNFFKDKEKNTNHLAIPQAFGEFSEMIEGQPRVGVFIFPGSDKIGELEDLCLESISHHSTMPCVDQFMNCIKNNKKAGKRKLHAWMLTHDRPDIRPNEAAGHGLFNFDHPAFSELKKFITQLSQEE